MKDWKRGGGMGELVGFESRAVGWNSKLTGVTRRLGRHWKWWSGEQYEALPTLPGEFGSTLAPMEVGSWPTFR